MLQSFVCANNSSDLECELCFLPLNTASRQFLDPESDLFFRQGVVYEIP